MELIDFEHDSTEVILFKLVLIQFIEDLQIILDAGNRDRFSAAPTASALNQQMIFFRLGASRNNPYLCEKDSIASLLDNVIAILIQIIVAPKHVAPFAAYHTIEGDEPAIIELLYIELTDLKLLRQTIADEALASLTKKLDDFRNSESKRICTERVRQAVLEERQRYFSRQLRVTTEQLLGVTEQTGSITEAKLDEATNAFKQQLKQLYSPVARPEKIILSAQVDALIEEDVWRIITCLPRKFLANPTSQTNECFRIDSPLLLLAYIQSRYTPMQHAMLASLLARYKEKLTPHLISSAHGLNNIYSNLLLIIPDRKTETTPLAALLRKNRKSFARLQAEITGTRTQAEAFDQLVKRLLSNIEDPTTEFAIRCISNPFRLHTPPTVVCAIQDEDRKDIRRQLQSNKYYPTGGTISISAEVRANPHNTILCKGLPIKRQSEAAEDIVMPIEDDDYDRTIAGMIIKARQDLSANQQIPEFFYALAGHQDAYLKAQHDNISNCDQFAQRYFDGIMLFQPLEAIITAKAFSGKISTDLNDLLGQARQLIEAAKFLIIYQNYSSESVIKALLQERNIKKLNKQLSSSASLFKGTAINDALSDHLEITGQPLEGELVLFISCANSYHPQ